MPLLIQVRVLIRTVHGVCLLLCLLFLISVRDSAAPAASPICCSSPIRCSTSFLLLSLSQDFRRPDVVHPLKIFVETLDLSAFDQTIEIQAESHPPLAGALFRTQVFAFASCEHRF